MNISIQSRKAKRRNARRGVSLIIIIQLFAVMLIFAFMAINISSLQRHHAAGQIAADLGSRWGVDMTSRESDAESIKKEVLDIVKRNWDVQSPNALGDVTVEVGSARPGANRMEFVKNALPYNSVRVDCGAKIKTAGFMASRGAANEVNRRSTAVAFERDICIVIDRSGSMNFDLNTANWSTDNSRRSDNPMSTSRYSNYRRNAHQWWWYWPHPTKSRWCTMVPALYGLADELDTTNQNELLSIVSYSTDFSYRFYDKDLRVKTYRGYSASEETKPSFDYHKSIKTFEYKYNNTQPVAGGTNISAGIDMGAKVLLGSAARPNAFKTMIVMTDGQYNSGRHPSLAASDAAEEGIEVFTVTFSRHADTRTMIETAEEGNGQHFHAPDGDALEDIFRKIANIPPAAYIN